MSHINPEEGFVSSCNVDVTHPSDVNVTYPCNDVTPPRDCVIKVFGVGGGGGNSLQHMINESLEGVDFIAVNTDSQVLRKSTAQTTAQIGVRLTAGLGAGCDPNKGRGAAEESKESLKELVKGADMVFITAGMGGGTGTGASPVIAQIAKEMGALTIAVVTKPFKFEGKRHMTNAEAGIAELARHVDSLIVIDNDKLLKNLGPNISIVNAFNAANDVLLNAVKGITDLITNPGYINLDFADVQTVMRGRGHALIGSGSGSGANFVHDAVEHAIHSPLIEPVDISSAAGLLVNVRVNPNFQISKWEEVCNQVQSYASEDADCKFGMTFDSEFKEDQMSITILITGIQAKEPNMAPNMATNMRMQQPMYGNQHNFLQGMNANNGMRYNNNNNVDMRNNNYQQMPQNNGFMRRNMNGFNMPHMQMNSSLNMQSVNQQPQQAMQKPLNTDNKMQTQNNNAHIAQSHQFANPLYEQFSADQEFTISTAPIAGSGNAQSQEQNQHNHQPSLSAEKEKATPWDNDMPPILRNKSR